MAIRTEALLMQIHKQGLYTEFAPSLRSAGSGLFSVMNSRVLYFIIYGNIYLFTYVLTATFEQFLRKQPVCLRTGGSGGVGENRLPVAGGLGQAGIDADLSVEYLLLVVAPDDVGDLVGGTVAVVHHGHQETQKLSLGADSLPDALDGF